MASSSSKMDSAVARWRQHLTADVRTQVEVRVVDPDRVSQVERDAMDTLAIAGHEVDALADSIFNPERSAAALDA